MAINGHEEEGMRVGKIGEKKKLKGWHLGGLLGLKKFVFGLREKVGYSWVTKERREKELFSFGI